MVGGTIVSVFSAADRVSLVVRGKDEDKAKYLAIDLVPSKNQLHVGDSIWWQGDTAFWTPQNRHHEDVPIKRIGYTYDADTLLDRVVDDLLRDVEV